MIRWIYLIIILGIALAVGPIVADYKGYILIAIGDWAVEMALVSFLLLLFGVMILTYLGFWLINRSWRLVSWSGSWWGSRSSRQKTNAFNHVITAIQESNLDEAKSQLTKLNADDFDGLPLLLKAQVAAKKGENDQALKYWQQAQDNELTHLAATLNIVRLELAHEQFSRALQRLNALSPQHHSHPKVINYHALLLARSGQWQALIEKLKTWKKSLATDEYSDWLKQALEGKFAEVASKEGMDALQKYWKGQKRATRLESDWQRIYVEQLIQLEQYSEAANALLTFQKKQPDPILLPLFRKLKLAQPAEVQKQLETWIKLDANNHSLYSILGEFAYQSKDWELADKALSKAVDMERKKEDLLLLAKVKEQMKDTVGALECYKSITI